LEKSALFKNDAKSTQSSPFFLKKDFLMKNSGSRAMSGMGCFWAFGFFDEALILFINL